MVNKRKKKKLRVCIAKSFNAQPLENIEYRTVHAPRLTKVVQKILVTGNAFLEIANENEMKTPSFIFTTKLREMYFF